MRAAQLRPNALVDTICSQLSCCWQRLGRLGHRLDLSTLLMSQRQHLQQLLA
jgi:hypothetical protein